MSAITTRDVMAWQNEMLAFRDERRKPYSQTYLKTVHNQLSAIFNYAVRHYDLRSNPAAKAGNMGTEERKEMQFWTKDEYKKFSEAVMDKPMSFYAFEMLYWCGIREGELLALTAADFDFEKETVRINKSYQRLHSEDVITFPKTKKSNRTIKMPKFLCDEMRDYISMIYGLKKKDRIFPVTKNYLHHEMDRGTRIAGVKRIRIHDLRHSHISLLIDFVSAGMCADIAIHDKKDGNPHAHIMLTMRPIEQDGRWGAKSKKEYILDENGERIKLKGGNFKTRKVNTVDWNEQDKAELWRASWAEFANRYLEQNSIPGRIDHRSFERQGIEQLPTIHLGTAAGQMERKGIPTECGRINRMIQKANQILRQINLKSAA